MYKIKVKDLKEKLTDFDFSSFDLIIAVSSRGDLIAEIISEKTGTPWLSYSDIVGKINPSDNVLLVDDIISTGKSVEIVRAKLDISESKTFAIAGGEDYNIYEKSDYVKIKKGWFF